MRRALPPLDLRLAGGRHAFADLGTGLPLCFVTMRGRKSGAPRTIPLLYGQADGGGIVIAATNWGQRHHPAWSSNLDANPDVTVAIQGLEKPMRARRATDTELARYWPRLTAFWPAYDTYRERSGRTIRVYVLEPA
jgi:deazaflavin-dependent oxidoreductase (nitroreductase family)